MLGSSPSSRPALDGLTLVWTLLCKNEKRLLSACKQSALFSAPLPPAVITQQITSFFKSSKPRNLSATGPQQVCVLQRWWRLYLHGISFESRCSEVQQAESLAPLKQRDLQALLLQLLRWGLELLICKQALTHLLSGQVAAVPVIQHLSSSTIFELEI